MSTSPASTDSAPAAPETRPPARDLGLVERAVDRALRRRVPPLLDDRLDAALAPLAREVATAFADIEFSVARLTSAEERARVAEQRSRLADDALAAARLRAAVLEGEVGHLTAQLERSRHELAALREQRTGLFRRRRAATA